MFSRLELTRMLLTMNASIALADKFHKNTGACVTQVKKNIYDVFGQHLYEFLQCFGNLTKKLGSCCVQLLIYKSG